MASGCLATLRVGDQSMSAWRPGDQSTSGQSNQKVLYKVNDRSVQGSEHQTKWLLLTASRSAVYVTQLYCLVEFMGHSVLTSLVKGDRCNVNCCSRTWKTTAELGSVTCFRDHEFLRICALVVSFY